MNEIVLMNCLMDGFSDDFFQVFESVECPTCLGSNLNQYFHEFERLIRNVWLN